MAIRCRPAAIGLPSLLLAGLLLTACTPENAAPAASPAATAPASTVAWASPAASGAPASAAPAAAPSPAAAASPVGRAVKAPTFQPAFAYADGDTVWAIDATGQARAELVALAKGSQTKYVAWSPDAQTVAFSALAPYTRGGNNGADLWLVGADGSNLRVAASHDAKDAVIEFPTWSTDGRFVYFSRSVPIYEGDRYVRNDYTVERVAAAGGAAEKLVADAAAPTLSSDGRTLAYLRIDGFRQILTVSDLDGANARTVIPADKEPPFIWGPAFAPDGKTLSFSAAGGSNDDPSMPTSASPATGRRAALAHPVGGPWELFTIRLDGTDMRQLTKLRDQYEEISQSWSPDGTRIAFVALGALNTIRADGSDLKKLPIDMPFGEVSWSPRAAEVP